MDIVENTINIVRNSTGLVVSVPEIISEIEISTDVEELTYIEVTSD